MIDARMVSAKSWRHRAIAVVLLVGPVGSQAEILTELPVTERAAAWFTPRLTTNQHPICDAMLQVERAKFFAPDAPAVEIPSLTRLSEAGAANVQSLGESPREYALTLPDRTQVFIYFERHPGCGGACETESVAIDATRLDAAKLADAKPPFKRIPPAEEWALYRASNGDFYLQGHVVDYRRLYRVTAAARWELACEVRLRPPFRDDSYPLKVSDAVHLLDAATEEMAGGEVECGTLQTYWRLNAARSRGLRQALYQPWALVERKRDRAYVPAEQGLRDWSLGGLREYRMFTAYREQLAQTSSVVAEFYVDKFGWSPTRASEMAKAALQGGVATGFGFRDYHPYGALGERQLREAILSRASLDKIRSIQLDIAAIDRADRDSILNVAMEYPEALRYLLDQGFNPNTANAFGKTPLMYAAQYDQLAAAEMLLQAGADPNAATYQPDDPCTYDLRMTNVTPVHYATRYASQPLIALLLEHGALSFSQSIADDAAEYPIDWLGKYAGRDRSSAEVTALSKLLVVPSDQQKTTMGQHLLAEARAQYARGNAVPAYQRLRAALIAQPANASAIADLPLMALRAGQFRSALVAADHATKTLTDPAALAASWFNKGLVCEHARVRALGFFNGIECELDVLEPFVKAWKMQPTAARANKLKALFKEGEWVCASATSSPKRSYRIARRSSEALRIYALHRPNDSVDPAAVAWAIKDWDRAPQPKPATWVEDLKLGDDSIAVLEISGQGHQLFIDGQVCKVSR